MTEMVTVPPEPPLPLTLRSEQLWSEAKDDRASVASKPERTRARGNASFRGGNAGQDRTATPAYVIEASRAQNEPPSPVRLRTRFRSRAVGTCKVLRASSLWKKCFEAGTDASGASPRRKNRR